ncbi:MAG TPA: MarR family transcriptional regulator [Sphingobium sp.]|nr:MarR family transcriptional regulator [Sphingobium sp.]
MPNAKPILGPYRESLAGTLLAAREAVMAPIRPMLRDANVTEQQWRVLRVLVEHDSLDARSIASAALLHAPSVTRILKELLDRGLIERRVDPNDSRRSIVSISDAGHMLVKLTARHTVQVINSYSRTFGPERLTALREELRAFIEAIAELGPRE